MEKLVSMGFGVCAGWRSEFGSAERAACAVACFQPEAEVKDVSSGMSVRAGRIDEKRGGELFAGSL